MTLLKVKLTSHLKKGSSVCSPILNGSSICSNTSKA